MKISKNKALELINEKISQFHKILEEATIGNIYDEFYETAYYGTENLLTELFSKEEAMNFRSIVSSPSLVFTRREELQDYRKHISGCIAQLKVYRERIQNFWGTDELETVTGSKIVPFVSMSFDESDQDTNQYFTGILTAMQIDFETGERY